MLNCVRGSDLFARYGGEEFAIVLVNSSRESALEAAERYHETVQSKLFETSVGSIACTFSGGIAVWTHENPISRAEFIAEADEKLYQAKTEGRNRIGY